MLNVQVKILVKMEMYQFLFFFFRVPGVFYLNTTSSYPFAERDAACAPGKTVSDNVTLIAASTGSGVLLLLFLVLGIFFVRKRRSEEMNSGFVIEEEEDDDIIDGMDDVLPGSVGSGEIVLDEEESIVRCDTENNLYGGNSTSQEVLLSV